jgi:hypothetical protein
VVAFSVVLYIPFSSEKKNEFGRAQLRGATGTDEIKSYKDNKEDKLVEMMQAFNKKLAFSVLYIPFSSDLSAHI